MGNGMGRLCALGLVAAWLLMSGPRALAWGHHDLVMDRALERAELKTTIDALVEPVPLEVFLQSCAAPIAQIFDAFYDELERERAKRFRRMVFDPSKPTREEFVRAARLNPGTIFPLLRRRLPGEKSPGPDFDYDLFKSDDVISPVFPVRFEEMTGKKMSVRQVLVTYADEPDWKMDQGLWSYPEYGYGKIPYGNEKGVSSRAGFHALFAHENILVRLFAPEVTEGLMLQRVRLFGALGRAAFQCQQPYWGFRFTAWTAHYLQDLSQPYHAKAVPFGDWSYYLKFVVSSDKARIKKETTQLAQNRHFAYEDFIAFALQNAYLPEPPEMSTRVAQYLANSPFVEPRATRLDWSTLAHQVSEQSSAHAPTIDAALSAAFGAKVASDPSYDLEHDPSYRIDQAIASLDPSAQARLLSEVRHDFELAGRATRTVIQWISFNPARSTATTRH